MLQLPTETSGSKSAPDPIFALVRQRSNLNTTSLRLSDELEAAENEAADAHGKPPIPLVHWRGYHIGGNEIDQHRERLLERGDAPAEIIEAEFLAAKAQEAALYAAEEAWYRKTGLVAKRKAHRRAIKADFDCCKRLAETRPTTPAAAAFFIDYLFADDLNIEEGFWHVTALKTIADALREMNVSGGSR